MCTGARYHDAGSEYQQGKFVFKGEFRSPDESIGSPCDGDKGTPLMVKENERYILQLFPFHLKEPTHGGKKSVQIVTGTRWPEFSANVSNLPLTSPTPPRLATAVWTPWCIRGWTRK